MHTMFCSHHSTIFLSSFKFYPSFSSFPNPKYTHFHLSPNEHFFLSFDINQLGTLFFNFILDFKSFWLSSFLFFSFPHSLIVSLILSFIFFFWKGVLFILSSFSFLTFFVPRGFFTLSTLFGSFFSLNLFSSQDQTNFKLTNPTTILEASSNEVLMLAKDENNPLSVLILSRFCT